MNQALKTLGACVGLASTLAMLTVLLDIASYRYVMMTAGWELPIEIAACIFGAVGMLGAIADRYDIKKED